MSVCLEEVSFARKATAYLNKYADVHSDQMPITPLEKELSMRVLPSDLLRSLQQHL